MAHVFQIFPCGQRKLKYSTDSPPYILRLKSMKIGRVRTASFLDDRGMAWNLTFQQYLNSLILLRRLRAKLFHNKVTSLRVLSSVWKSSSESSLENHYLNIKAPLKSCGISYCYINLSQLAWSSKSVIKKV